MSRMIWLLTQLSVKGREKLMNETQESISKWAEETFGPVGSNGRVAARANEELSELLRALSADDGNPKAAEEAADVLIVLYRLNARLGFPAFDRSTTQVAHAKSNFELAVTAHLCMGDIMLSLAREEAGVTSRYEVFRPMYGMRTKLRDMNHYLLMLSNRMGFKLAAEVEKKMAVNRAREWKLDGSGHGYHVRDKGLPVVATP